MHKYFAEPLRVDGRGFATYGDYLLKGVPPKDFDGEVVDVEAMELPKPDFSEKVDLLLAATPTGRLVKIADNEGKWLQQNHPAFKAKTTVLS